MSEKIVVGGFQFLDEEQAKIARTELKRIEILDAKLDYKNLDAVANVYVKARDNMVFQTPVGLSYMQRLLQYLQSSNYDAVELKAIVVPISAPGKENGKEIKKPDEGVNETEKQQHASYEGEPGGYKRPASESVWKSRLDAAKSRERRLHAKIKLLLAADIVLVLLVIFMFVVSLTTNHPTILNYKSKLISRYSTWEQELSEREKAVKEKERKLGMQDEKPQTIKDEDALTE